MRSTVFTAAPVLRSLLALGAPKDQSGVSLIVRNDDGLNTDTLRLALPNDKRKRGQNSCPLFLLTRYAECGGGKYARIA